MSTIAPPIPKITSPSDVLKTPIDHLLPANVEPASIEAVTPERIRARAYEIFIARNGSGRPGDSVSDWMLAERELNERVPDPSASEDIEAKAQVLGGKLSTRGLQLHTE